MGSCFVHFSGGSTSDWDYSTRKEIDPHFYEDNKIVTRFKPEEDKRLAKILAGVQDV